MSHNTSSRLRLKVSEFDFLSETKPYFTCKDSVCNLAVADSDKLLDTPLLTPDVEWCPEAFEMLEKPDWVDWRLVMEPM